MRTAMGCVVLAAALLGPFGARAQGVVTQRILSLNVAKIMAEAALAECRGRGFHTSAAVVDRSGTLLVLLRDELASPATIDMARSKAYTALVFRSPTNEFQKATAEDPTRAPQRNVPPCPATSFARPRISAPVPPIAQCTPYVRSRCEIRQ